MPTVDGHAPSKLNLAKLGAINSISQVIAKQSGGILGIGQGLNICKNIIEAYERKVRIESEIYFGTKIIINLPK